MYLFDKTGQKPRHYNVGLRGCQDVLRSLVAAASGPAADAASRAAFRASLCLPVEGPIRVYLAAIKWLGEVVRDPSLCEPAAPVLQQHFQRRGELPEYLA